MKFSFFLLKRIRLSFGRLNRSQFPLFAALFLLGISPAAADPFDLVPETVSENYQILYEIDLPENNAFRNANPVPYLQDHRESIPEFDRVAYFLKLEKNETTNWVYVSMDAFTSDPAELAVPHNIDNPIIHQRPVENLNVFSNVSELKTGTFLDGGHLEIWPSNYSEHDGYGVFGASHNRFDWGDSGASTSSGYGSFQIHNAIAKQTIFAWNGWGKSTANIDDIGIGNQPQGEPDWTFAENADDFSSRKLLILVRPRMADLHLSEFPKNRQLYPRNLKTNLAKIEIRGEERSGNFEQILLRIRRNGNLHFESAQTLDYSENVANFSFEPTIEAELAHYDFELWLDDGNDEKLFKKASQIVAGDSFIVYGQSNAESPQTNPNQSANGYASPWILTFGQNGDNGNHTAHILHWVEAEGDGTRDDPGSIGQWPMVVAREIVDSEKIPVAILNGSRLSYEIRRLLKDRDDPDNLLDTTFDDVRRPYNRLRFRAIEAGIAEKARAILFYQGESDNEKAGRHADGYQILREDWAVDFPGIEHFYVTQLRPGCGVSVNNVSLRELQRKLPDLYPNTSIMSTNGLEAHDGCHFHFTDGYEELGKNYSRMILRDLYDHPDLPDIDPPNPSIATFTDSSRTEIEIHLRKPATIDFPIEALADFHLSGSSSEIIGRTVQANSLLLQLDEPAKIGALLEYRSHDGSGKWITNANGIGLLSFSIPVRTIDLNTDGTDLSSSNPTQTANNSDEILLTVQLRDGEGNPVRESNVSVVFQSNLGTFPNGKQLSDPVFTDNSGTAQSSLVSKETGHASITAKVEGASVLRNSPLIVEFLPGPAEKLVFLQQPSDTTIHQPISPAVEVALQDSFGNAVSDEIQEIFLTLQNNPENAVLTGTLSTMTENGIAEFPDLSVDQIGTGFIILATSTNLEPAESETFSISAGAGYPEWAKALPENARDKNDDAGELGIPNIRRYAYGLDPLQPDFRNLPRISIIEYENNPHLALVFQRRTDDPSLDYLIERADALNEFTPLENPIISIESNQPPVETIKVIDPNPISGIERRFLRIQIESPD